MPKLDIFREGTSSNTPPTNHRRTLAGGCFLAFSFVALTAGFGDWLITPAGAPPSVGTRVVQPKALRPTQAEPSAVTLQRLHSEQPIEYRTAPDRLEAAIIATDPPTQLPATNPPTTLTTTVAITVTVAIQRKSDSDAKHLRHRECSEQAHNFGTVKTPAECDVLTVKTAVCGSHFMFSAEHPDWACRCCAPDGQDDGPTSPVWDVYTVQGDLPLNRRPGHQSTAPILGLPPSTGQFTAKYGFYIHVFRDPAAVIHQVRQLQKFFPTSPIYVMSDGGMDFTEMCKHEHCIFRLCPPANDRWHPWPFLRRMFDAALALKTEYLIMLEPDNTVHGFITRPPTHAAGGLYVSGRSFGCREVVERLAQKRVPGFKWTDASMRAGLAGGAYFRVDAILDAFSDESVANVDWNFIGDQCSKEIFSSDFAMQYLLAARGWPVHAWHESAQMDRDKDNPLTGPKDSSFRHYCSCYPGGKPTYNLHVKMEDHKLFTDPPHNYGQHGSVCQLCYNHSRYVELWGSDECTNKHPFEYSEKLLARHHPEMKRGHHCPGEMKWFCGR